MHARTPTTPPEVIGIIGKQFRAQPILCSKTHDIHRIEILSREDLDFKNKRFMLQKDVAALRAASLLSRLLQINVHCNAEIFSIIHPAWTHAVHSVDLTLVTVEIIERNHLLTDAGVFSMVFDSISIIRKKTGHIAIDNVSCSEIEAKEIRLFNPDFVKIQDLSLIPSIKEISGARIIAERIETEKNVPSKVESGIDLIQGYWCDCIAKQHLPDSLN